MISEALIAALIWVESKGVNNARNGDAVGCLQIRPCVLVDVNFSYHTHYRPDDRLSRKKSTEICRKYLLLYRGKFSSEAEYAACWRFGPVGSRRMPFASAIYWLKVSDAIANDSLSHHEKHTSRIRGLDRFLHRCAHRALYGRDEPRAHFDSLYQCEPYSNTLPGHRPSDEGLG
jgi:hypothetical protein